MDIISILSSELSIKKSQAEKTVGLIDDGNTIPFIARYRKEATGGLDDVTLRSLNERLVYLRNLNERKDEVIRLIDEQGKLNDDIVKKLNNATMLREIEDIYRPYKQKKKTRASEAKDKGLEPLAVILFKNMTNGKEIKDIALDFIDNEKGIENIEQALNGAMDIIAETVSDNRAMREYVRDMYLQEGMVESTAKKDEDSVYRIYYDYKEPVSKIAGHRVLALNRGEREGFLKVKISVPDSDIIKGLILRINGKKENKCTEYIKKAIEDGYKRLVKPSVEKEIMHEITEKAEEKAMEVFTHNLKNLLMQPPVREKVVMGIDPAYRTGCKIAVVNRNGKVMDTAVIYPTPPQCKVKEAKEILRKLIKKHSVSMLAIGNGTASRETEEFAAGLISETGKELSYVIVNEAGASVYSASEIGTREFPELDVSLRSAVSIARRLQDPLAELVKIEPESIGVGQYQHDMNKKRLSEKLGGVVEDCVNNVGVDLNTASPSLLSYVSGINKIVSENIFKYREEKGGFISRHELLNVPKLGKKAFLQCAGFLRIAASKNILDNTAVHPESYDAAERLIKVTGYSKEDVKNLRLDNIEKKVEEKGIGNIAKSIGIGVPTLFDIIEELKKPGRDVRENHLKPVLKKGIMDIKDLKQGMVLKGTVRNVADFGAFIDIGVHQDGLVHISELSNSYVKTPMDIVAVGDIVDVLVLDVDVDRNRISLSMKQA